MSLDLKNDDHKKQLQEVFFLPWDFLAHKVRNQPVIFGRYEKMLLLRVRLTFGMQSPKYVRSECHCNNDMNQRSSCVNCVKYPNRTGFNLSLGYLTPITLPPMQ